MSLLLLVACGTVGLESWNSGPGKAHVDIEPAGRVEFPDTSPEGHSEETEVSVVNSGDGAATIEDAWVEGADSGAFFLEGLRLPTELAPGEAYTFTAHFLPADAGLYQGTLVVVSGEGAYVERLLMGTGCRDENRDGRC